MMESRFLVAEQLDDRCDNLLIVQWLRVSILSVLIWFCCFNPMENRVAIVIFFFVLRNFIFKMNDSTSQFCVLRIDVLLSYDNGVWLLFV